jgi:tRNA G10  N-methylase Trm11
MVKWIYSESLFFRLADIQPGDIVIDPMCGGGSIPIEAALTYPAAFHIGGDFHEKAVTR